MPPQSPFESKMFWQRELKNINNLPKKRMTLLALLQDPEPIIRGQNYDIRVDKEELDRLSSFFSPDVHGFVRVPLVFLSQGDHYITSGGKWDIWAVERLMGHDPELHDFILSIKDYKPKFEYYYTYQVRRITRMFPTLVQVVYSLG